MDLGSIQPGTAALAFAQSRRYGLEGDAGFAKPGDQMASGLDQPQGHRTAGVVGVGDEVERLGNPEIPDQGEEFLGESPLVTVAEDESLVNAGGQRHGEERSGRGHQDRDDLKGMPHDVLGLGVAIGDLVQEFHGGHLTATLGDLETIAEKHRSAVDSMNARHARKDRLHPATA